jgi:hypothetical protein
MMLAALELTALTGGLQHRYVPCMVDSDAGSAQKPTLAVQSLVDGVFRDVPAEELRLTLPNGIVVEVWPDERLGGSLVLRLDGSPEDPHLDMFMVRPGAVNVLVIGAERQLRAERSTH